MRVSAGVRLFRDIDSHVLKTEYCSFTIMDLLAFLPLLGTLKGCKEVWFDDFMGMAVPRKRRRKVNASQTA